MAHWTPLVLNGAVSLPRGETVLTLSLTSTCGWGQRTTDVMFVSSNPITIF